MNVKDDRCSIFERLPPSCSTLHISKCHVTKKAIFMFPFPVSPVMSVAVSRFNNILINI
jgi:hypothetical protein